MIRFIDHPHSTTILLAAPHGVSVLRSHFGGLRCFPYVFPISPFWSESRMTKTLAVAGGPCWSWYGTVFNAHVASIEGRTQKNTASIAGTKCSTPRKTILGKDRNSPYTRDDFTTKHGVATSREHKTGTTHTIVKGWHFLRKFAAKVQIIKYVTRRKNDQTF